jgi:hypothetical protein
MQASGQAVRRNTRVGECGDAGARAGGAAMQACAQVVRCRRAGRWCDATREQARAAMQARRQVVRRMRAGTCADAGWRTGGATNRAGSRVRRCTPAGRWCDAICEHGVRCEWTGAAKCDSVAQGGDVGREISGGGDCGAGAALNVGCECTTSRTELDGPPKRTSSWRSGKAPPHPPSPWPPLAGDGSEVARTDGPPVREAGSETTGLPATRGCTGGGIGAGDMGSSDAPVRRGRRARFARQAGAWTVVGWLRAQPRRYVHGGRQGQRSFKPRNLERSKATSR